MEMHSTSPADLHRYGLELKGFRVTVRRPTVHLLRCFMACSLRKGVAVRALEIAPIPEDILVSPDDIRPKPTRPDCPT